MSTTRHEGRVSDGKEVQDPVFLRRFLRRPWREKAHGFRYRIKRAWGRMFPSIPLPVRLPCGGWWLASNDVCGDAVFAGRFEQDERRFVEKFLKPGMTVVDAGAHHGFYTILAAKRVGKTGQVFAFEPSPRERETLHLNLRLNRLGGRVKVLPLALRREEGKASFYLVQGKDTGCNSLRAPVTSEPTRTLTVQTASLDSFLAEERIPKVDFIKVDVEGAELEFLEGSIKLLSQSPRPVFLAELADSRTHPWGYPASAIYDFLAGRRYQWFAIRKGGALRPHPRREFFSENLVAFPEERLPDPTAVCCL